MPKGASYWLGSSYPLARGDHPEPPRLRILDMTDKTVLLSQVKTLEARLFDSEHHVRGEVTADRAREVLTQINVVRSKLGWLQIDDRCRYLWPEGVPGLSSAGHAPAQAA